MLNVKRLVTLQCVSVKMALLVIHSVTAINIRTSTQRKLHRVNHHLADLTLSAESKMEPVLALVYLTTWATLTKDVDQNV